MAINHLHLKVRDVARARAFYAGHFGLRDLSLHDDGVLFMRDDRGLDLALAPAEVVESLPSWFHFGVRADSAAEVERLHQRLAAAGAPMVEGLTREDELLYFRCADPDGYHIEVYWEPDPVAAPAAGAPPPAAA